MPDVVPGSAEPAGAADLPTGRAEAECPSCKRACQEASGTRAWPRHASITVVDSRNGPA